MPLLKPGPALFSKQGAADYLGVNLRWIERHVMEFGEIPYHKLGRLVRIRKEDLDAYIESTRRGDGDESWE